MRTDDRTATPVEALKLLSGGVRHPAEWPVLAGTVVLLLVLIVVSTPFSAGGLLLLFAFGFAFNAAMIFVRVRQIRQAPPARGRCSGRHCRGRKRHDVAGGPPQQEHVGGSLPLRLTAARGCERLQRVQGADARR